VAQPPCRVVFSFNGGKDSTVVLHLLRAVLAERYGAHETAPSPASPSPGLLGGLVPVVYFAAAGEFPAVLEFMTQCEGLYGFVTRHVPEFKTGIAELRGGGARAVLMGTRRTDPHGGSLQHFTPTTLNWPPMMRICPVLNWTYRMVWTFLRCAVGAPPQPPPLPYCALYDAGYTSLGSVSDSVRNPALARAEEDTFLPAYMLGDDALERAGRGRGVTASPAATAARQPRAAILIVGDEVLSGRVRDANSPYLASHLTGRGLAVCEIATVADDTAAIAAAVRRLSSEHEYVLSCGGLGPTHDDVTMRGIADAFHYPMRACPRMAAFLTALFHRTHSSAVGSERDEAHVDGIGGETRVLTAATPATEVAAAVGSGPASHATPLEVFLRMAILPCAVDVTLHYPDGSQQAAFDQGHSASAAVEAPSVDSDQLLARGYPLVQVRNVWVFPGVPAIVRRKYRAHARLFAGGTAAVTELLRVPGGSEPQIAPHLEALLAAWQSTAPHAVKSSGSAGSITGAPSICMSQVKLGSYPDDDDAFAAVHMSGGHSTRGSVVGSPAVTPTAAQPAAPPALTLSGDTPAVMTPAASTGVTISVTAVGDGAAEAVAAAVAALKQRLGLE